MCVIPGPDWGLDVGLIITHRKKSYCALGRRSWLVSLTGTEQRKADLRFGIRGMFANIQAFSPTA
jgi:hypothetical protein